MNYDKSKVKTGSVYPVKDKHLVFAGGYLRITTEGITCFQDIAPYNQTTGEAIPHAYPGHGGVDVRAAVGTPVYAVKDLTIKTGRDDYGNKVICNGRRMRHMDKLPSKTSFKAGEIVFYTGSDCTSAAHLHIGQEDGGDEFASMTEGKSSSKTVKGYSFNECYGYHPSTGKLCWFDIELYGSTQDDICFEVSNLTKNSDGTYTLKSNEDGYVANTKFRKIKTTFYK